jgi:hypothetical protein
VGKDTTCCYAVEGGFWVTAPGAEDWEHDAVLADSQPELEGQPASQPAAVAGDGACCPTDTGATAGSIPRDTMYQSDVVPQLSAAETTMHW